MTPGEACYLESIRGATVSASPPEANVYPGHRLPWRSLQPWVRAQWERIAEAGHVVAVVRDAQAAAEKARREMRSDLFEREVQRQIQERKT